MVRPKIVCSRFGRFVRGLFRRFRLFSPATLIADTSRRVIRSNVSFCFVTPVSAVPATVCVDEYRNGNFWKTIQCSDERSFQYTHNKTVHSCRVYMFWTFSARKNTIVVVHVNRRMFYAQRAILAISGFFHHRAKSYNTYTAARGCIGDENYCVA